MVPESVLEVVTPAGSLALADLAELKSDLGIPEADTSHDARLKRILSATRGQVVAYIGSEVAAQVYKETWRLPPGGLDYWSIMLPRDLIRYLPLKCFPVTAIDKAVEAGKELDPSLYQWVDTKGLVRLEAGGGVSAWASGVIEVTYKAGWEDGKVPDDLTEAVLLAARGAFMAKDRDPGQVIRSESVQDVYSVTYDTRTGFGGGVAGEGTYGLPPAVTAMLDAYRRQTFAF